ncbi:MAG TPA: tetratricopeptide repeat protein [Candidatus Gastranaerophilales bacterium]|nr:tetratricopeptide repeat protein [Candidatus Gastranaerophilales bacterium]
MKKTSFASKLSLIVVAFSAVFLLGGCDQSPEALQKNGFYYYQNNDYLFSACNYKFLLEKQPDNPIGYYGVAINYTEIDDYDGAITNFKKAIELSGNANYQVDLATFYLGLAKAYHKNAEYQEAGKTLKKANEIDPAKCIANDNHLFQCTRIYDYAGLIKNAIDLHNRYNYAEEFLPRKYRILAYLYLRDHNYDEAIKMAAKAIEKKPENELAYYLMGIASGEKGQYDKAVDAFRKAIQIKDHASISTKKYLPIYISLAYYLAKNEQNDEALAAYNDAIQNTKNLTYQYPYTRMLYSSVTGTYVPSKAYATGSVSYDDYLSQRDLAYAYYNAGRYDEAFVMLNSQISELEKGRIGIVALDSYYLKQIFDNNKHIVSVAPGSPAEKAGLRFWDTIISVNGKSAKGSAEHFVNMVAGPVGTEVTLKIKRYEDPVNKKGKTVFEQKLVREKIKNKNELNKLAKMYGLRSLIYRAKGETENAFADAEKAMSYNPESFDAKLAWGLAQNDKGKYSEALKILSSAKLPENETLYEFDLNYFITPFACGEELIKLGKANAYLKLGKVNDAISYLPQAELSYSLPPIQKEFQTLAGELTELAQAHNTKAVNLHKKGFLKEALNEYTAALSYTGNAEQEEEIRNNYINLLQEYPVSPELSEEARKYLVRGEVLFKQGDMAGALNECKKGLKLAPYYAKFYFNIAELSGGLKIYDQAIEYMKIYIKMAPNAPDIQNAKDEVTKWELLQEKIR